MYKEGTYWHHYYKFLSSLKCHKELLEQVDLCKPLTKSNWLLFKVKGLLLLGAFFKKEKVQEDTFLQLL